MAVFKLTQIVSNFGWNPRRNKIVVGREIVPVAVHKMYKKAANNAFKFLQAFVFINDVRIYKMCRIQWGRKKRKKVLRTYLFVRKCDRSNRCKGGSYCPWVSWQKNKNNRLSPLLLRTFGSKLNLVWSRSSKMGAALNSPLSLCSSVDFDLIRTGLSASCLVNINWRWSFDDPWACLCIMICKSPS